MKLPFDLSLKFVFRILLPGLILALGLLPVLEAVLKVFNATKYDQAIFVAVALVAGYCILLLDMPIYMLYEGRRWPRWLYLFLKIREQQRLENLLGRVDRYENKCNRSKVWPQLVKPSKISPPVDLNQNREAWVDIRQFPLDDKGRPVASAPTRLGNLLASIEEYSDTRYRMDSAFYWPRLWLKLDKDTREEIDNSQALADSALYSSFALNLVGGLYGLYAFLEILGVRGIGGADSLPVYGLLVIALLALAGAYLVYRVSLQANYNFGELWKAVFDLYHSAVEFPEVVSQVGEITGNNYLPFAPPRTRVRETWRYLQYYRVLYKEQNGADKIMPVPEAIEKRSAQNRADGKRG